MRLIFQTAPDGERIAVVIVGTVTPFRKTQTTPSFCFLKAYKNSIFQNIRFVNDFYVKIKQKYFHSLPLSFIKLFIR